MLWRHQEHEGLTDRVWDAGACRAAISAIVADAETAMVHGGWPGHPADGLDYEERSASAYLGSAGVIWALARLGSGIGVDLALGHALERYREAPDFGSEAHPPSLLAGETGLLLVAHVLGSAAADDSRLERLVSANQNHPSWELMWGSPGTILAARACGLQHAARASAERLRDRWDPSGEAWTQTLGGRRRRYLGPVHGFAGNVHALRGHVPDHELRRRVAGVLERTALRAGDLANWPPSLEEPTDRIRVQWCHGAPGIVSTIGDLLPLELALAGAELTWRAGPLAKGGSLCHGTAGNGFALLRLHELTGDALWLERARRFAMHAIEQVRRQRERFGRGRYALFTGDVGVALYLDACLHADARFPLIDRF